MMSIWLFPCILFFSCIDIITNKEYYNSLHFSGGSWIEMEKINSMKMTPESNDFTLQFWVSGGVIDTNEAPALFSIMDTENNIKLALYRDKGNNNSINTIVNSGLIHKDKDFNNNIFIDWAEPDSFYLVSLLISNKSFLKGYVNKNIFINEADLNNSKIDFDNESLIIGAVVNQSRTIIENGWHGYIDEIRLWNTLLSDSTIKFQSDHPNKLSEFYRYTLDGLEIKTYLDSLLGLWRCNFEKPVSILEDASINNNDGIIYTLKGFAVQLSKKGK